MSTFRVRMTQGDVRTGDGNLDKIALMNGAVTGATNASPIVVTSTAHGLVSGTKVTVQSVGGNTNANGDWVITVVDANTFQLNGSAGNAGYTSGGVWKVDSLQRTMYAMGPNLKNRKLADGQVFTDSNYWKQYTYPTVPYNQAFIEVVSDDGSVYIPGQPNTFVRTYTSVVPSLSTYASGGITINVLGDNNGYAAWATITTDQTIQCQVNGAATSSFTITGGTSFSFQVGDLLIGTLQFQRTASGVANVTTQLGINTVATS